MDLREIGRKEKEREGGKEGEERLKEGRKGGREDAWT